jgi:hypothetical protein
MQHVIELKLKITHFDSNRKSYNEHIASLDMRCKISKYMHHELLREQLSGGEATLAAKMLRYAAI